MTSQVYERNNKTVKQSPMPVIASAHVDGLFEAILAESFGGG
jgi:hypothetical protein